MQRPCIRGLLHEIIHHGHKAALFRNIYGNPHILEPDFSPDPDGKSDCSNSYLFTGRELDIFDSGSLKIQYNRNRYYDQYTGRWITHDPLGYIDGMNLYEYVGSNPVGRTDPHGEFILKIWHCAKCMRGAKKVAKTCAENKPKPPPDDCPIEKDIEYWEAVKKWELWCRKKIIATVPSCIKCIWAIPNVKKII